MRQSLGSNSPLVTRGSYQFPTYGLAVCGEKQIPTICGVSGITHGRNFCLNLKSLMAESNNKGTSLCYFLS